MSNIQWIKGGRVIDPANDLDQVGDVFIKDGKIVSSLSDAEMSDAQVHDAQGLIVSPGLVDIHVHLREPGQTHKENIRSGTAAAAAGGVTTVVAMPNTAPACDNAGTIQLMMDIVERESYVNVYPTGTLTIGRHGKELAPMGALKAAGVVAVTDDGDCVQDNGIMRHACEYAAMHNLPIMDHCQDMALTSEAVMNEGVTSTETGLKGWPNAAEDVIVNRNIVLSHYTGAHIHMQHITSAYSVDMLRRAKERGISVTAEVTPHHLVFTEECLKDFDTNYKMNPPLRTENDRKALIEGVLDDTINIISTDHAPHAEYEKDATMNDAPFGILGLQTLLPVSLEVFYHSGLMKLDELLSRLTTRPAALMGLNKGTLLEGADGDVTVFNPDEEWTFTDTENQSKSKNSPWLGKKLKGRVKMTFVKGQKVFDGVGMMSEKAL